MERKRSSEYRRNSQQLLIGYFRLYQVNYNINDSPAGLGNMLCSVRASRRDQKQEKSYCEFTTKLATSFSFPDPKFLASIFIKISFTSILSIKVFIYLRQTYCSYILLFICLVSKVCRPGGQRRSCAFSISSVTMCDGQPDS